MSFLGCMNWDIDELAGSSSSSAGGGFFRGSEQTVVGLSRVLVSR